MEQKIKVDVIVPVYNVEAYLKQCLDSLVKQTIPVRIIIVNDGSQDQSKEIALNYVEQYQEQICYIEQENAGLSAARNAGITQATAPYIAFMDSDDWVGEDYYEKLLSCIEQTKADIVCSDITYAYENGKMVQNPSHKLPENALNGNLIANTDSSYMHYLISIFPMAQNKLWRTDLIKNKFTFLEGKQYEDLDFFYRVYPSTKKIAFVVEDKFYYRQRAGSIVKTADHRILDIMAIFNNIIAYYQEHDLFDTYQAEIEYLLIRNCLVASSKRIAYSRKYYFIRTNLNILFTYVNDTVPNWRENQYIKSWSLRHLFIRSFSKKTLTLHSVFLFVLSFFLKK